MTDKKPISTEEVSEKEKVLDNPIVIEKSEDRIESEIIGDKLTPRQEKFCQLYSTDTEFFGNGVQTYLEVYDIDTEKKGRYKTACICASQLLSNPKVYNRINDLLESQGLNDEFVDKQLLFLISQQDDKSNKLGAIKEYNKLKQRITDKIESVGESETAKKEVYEELKGKIKDMKTEDLNNVIQDLLK